MLKSLTVWITTNCEKFLKRWEYHLTCLPRNLYAGQEVTVWTGHGPTDWFQIGKEVCQGCISSPCLFNLYTEYIMRNPRLDKVQTGIKIAGRNVNQFSSVQFSCLVLSNSLRPHGLQHARPPCPTPTPRVYPNSCPLSRRCHPVISSSVIPFSSHLQSFPVSGSFQMSKLVTSGGQSIRVSPSASVLPMNTQDWFRWGWTAWISL